MQHVLEDDCGLILLIFIVSLPSHLQGWKHCARLLTMPLACGSAEPPQRAEQLMVRPASALRLVWLSEPRGLLVSVLAADWSGCLLVRLWWTGEVTNVQPLRFSSCVHKREFHICASHLNIYFIYVHWTLCGNNLIQAKTMRTIWWTVLLIQLHSQTKYYIQWGTRGRNHVFGTIKGIYSFKLSEKDSQFFL